MLRLSLCHLLNLFCRYAQRFCSRDGFYTARALRFLLAIFFLKMLSPLVVRPTHVYIMYIMSITYILYITL